MESGKKVMAGAILALFLAACSGEEKARIVSLTSEQVKVVSGGFLIGNQPAVSLFIGPDDFDFFEISLERQNVKAGYRVEDRDNTAVNFSITANWKGEHYVQSAHRETFVTFHIRSLMEDEAVVEVSAKLLSMSSGRFLVLTPSTIMLKEPFLKTLRALE